MLRCVILDQPAVAGIDVGAARCIRALADNAKVFDFSLDESDEGGLRLYESRDLFQRIGDCGDEYRR